MAIATDPSTVYADGAALGAPSGGGSSGDVLNTGYATLLDATTAAVLADVDGAVYRLDDGRAYTYHSASKSLWPPLIYGQIDDVVVDASSNPCYGTLADSMADIAGRVTVGETGTGASVTKTEGGPLVLTSDNPATSIGEIDFTSANGETAVAALVCVSAVSGVNMGGTRIRLLVGTRQLRLSLTRGSAGEVDILQAFNAEEADQKGDVEISTSSDTWLLIHMDTRDVENLARVTALDDGEMVAVEIGEMLTGGPWSTSFEANTQNTTNQPASFSLKHFAFVGLV